MDIALERDVLAVKYNLEEFAKFCDEQDFINVYNRSRPGAHSMQSYQENNGKTIYLRMNTPKKKEKE
jgi:hypothetical protein